MTCCCPKLAPRNHVLKWSCSMHKEFGISAFVHRKSEMCEGCCLWRRASPPQRPTYGFFAAAAARGRCRWHRSQGLQLRNTCCRPVSRALMDDVLASVCHLAGRPLPRRLACGSLPASDSALEEQLREVLGVLEGGRVHRAKCLAVLAGVAS